MKYILYRSFGEIEENLEKHEIVGVELGKDIYGVADALIKDVVEDLSEIPEYEHCKVVAYAPNPMHPARSDIPYKYMMYGVVLPPHADKNIIIDYGIIEAKETGAYE